MTDTRDELTADAIHQKRMRFDAEYHERFILGELESEMHAGGKYDPTNPINIEQAMSEIVFDYTLIGSCMQHNGIDMMRMAGHITRAIKDYWKIEGRRLIEKELAK